MTYPVHPYVRPSALQCAENGQLPSTLRTTIGPNGGSLERSVVAPAWGALWVQAAAAGCTGADALPYTPGGTYRTLASQEALFYRRWQPAPEPPAAMEPAEQQLWHMKQAHEFYAGQWWQLRAGVARAGVPGTSKHGDAAAIDTALGASPTTARSIASMAPGAKMTGLAWLLAPAPKPYDTITLPSGVKLTKVCNAVSCGFSWEAQSEPWHLRWVMGDKLPQRVTDTQAWLEAMRKP